MSTKRSSDPATAFEPIYRRLFDHYREAIILQHLRPGDRVDSINEIQERHRVSRETAKQVLKMLAGEGYIIQQAGKGSFVADLRKRKRVWGVVLPFYSAQYETLLELLEAHARTTGRTLTPFLSYNNWEEETRLVGRMISERYEAVIVAPTLDESKTADFYRRLVSPLTVVCLIDHTMTGSFFSYVIQSYDLGVRRGLQYLAGERSGNLVFVRNASWAGRDLVQDMMEATYREFIEGSGRQTTPMVIERYRDLDREYITANRVTGVFCCDDTTAVRVMGRLREQSIDIPQEVNLVSYGNSDYARFFSPPLTSIDGCLEEMASMTVAIIQSRLEGKDVSKCQYVVQPRLIQRGT